MAPTCQVQPKCLLGAQAEVLWCDQAGLCPSGASLALGVPLSFPQAPPKDIGSARPAILLLLLLLLLLALADGIRGPGDSATGQSFSYAARSGRLAPTAMPTNIQDTRVYCAVQPSWRWAKQGGSHGLPLIHRTPRHELQQEWRPSLLGKRPAPRNKQQQHIQL